MSGKIALPTTPKLESQSLSGDTESKAAITRRLLKGAALGAAAWLIVTSALGAGPAWDRDGFAPFGFGKHKHAHGRVDCSVWEDFDFGEPVNFGERHARPHAHPHRPHGVPRPPQPPPSPDVPHPPNMPHSPDTPHLPDMPHPPRAPHPPTPPRGPHSPPESQVFNISSGVSEIRLASLGFLGHGVFRVEAAAEGIDYAQVEVKGAHGRVCVLKDAADEVMGVGLVGYMHGRRRGQGGRRWWHRWGNSKRAVASPHGHLPAPDTEDQDQFVEDESSDNLNAPSHPAPPSDHPFPHHPPGGELPPPPPPPPGGRFPPPPHGDFPHPPPAPGPRPHSHPHHTHAVTLIILRVPAADLPALRTRLPFFTHDIASTAATFAGLDLSTRDASIGLEDIVVRDGGNVTVRSVNAPIRGDVKLLDGWAVIETRNAVVDINVSLGGKHNSGVDVRSANAPIISSIELLASGTYSTSFSTSNAHLALNVTSHPEGAKLFLTGLTSNAPSSVQLHPTYQGTFELSSSVVTPAVVVADQEGRHVEFERDGGSVKGSVWKEKDEEARKEGGEVVVSTSNAPNILML